LATDFVALRLVVRFVGLVFLTAFLTGRLPFLVFVLRAVTARFAFFTLVFRFFAFAMIFLPSFRVASL
jgi:hypothetical protein